MRLLRRLALLAPLALTAQATPSSDMTAVYNGGGGGESLRIEAAANGDLRIGDGRDRYLLWKDGEGYVVSAGPGGPVVERMADIAAARADAGVTGAAVAKPEEWVAGESATVNGRTGTVYSVKGIKSPDPGWLPVFSSDPALAPVAKALARRGEFWAIMPAAENDPSAPGLLKLLATGAPLRLSGNMLAMIDNKPIPATRFALPAAPEPSAEVRAEWRGMYRTGEKPDDMAAFNRMALKRAAFADGKLWLLSDSGVLTTIDPVTKAVATPSVPGVAIDLCRDRSGLVVLTGAAMDPSWTLRRRVGEGWREEGMITARGERPIALDCSGGRMSVLTAQRLIDVSRGAAKDVALAEPFTRPGVISTTYDTGDALLVGVDAGEWGGGLRRIDRATGAVSMIENKASADQYCKKPLDAACDAVNGIAAMPGRPDCVVAAIGLVHMAPHGRLVSICGREVASIYYKPYTIDPWPGFDPKVPEPFETVAFFGLSRTRDALWAVGTDGLYRIGADSAVTFRKMPVFERIGGFWVSFASPDLILVRTSINQRMSLSGAVPMLVSR